MNSRTLRKYWEIFNVVLLSTTGFVSPSLSQISSDVRTYYSLTDPKYNSIILARIGNLEITAQEFLLNYEFGPAFPKREKDSKKRYLNFMINEKLLALDGYSRGVQSSEEVKQTLAAIEGDLATEELYKDDVLSKVKVSEAEIENGMQKERLHISVKWLYARTMEEITHQQHSLAKGASFDSLFALQLCDSVKLDERLLETTKFKLETKNPVLASIVDTLAFGKASLPINAPDGWYIVKIVDGWINAIMTQSEEMKLRYDVSRALVQRKSDKISDQYVRQMMLDQNPVIVRQTFEILQAHLGENILSPETFSKWGLSQGLMKKWGPLDFSKIEVYGDKELVTLTCGSITLKDFLTWYKARAPYIRLNTLSPQSFFISIEQLVWRMVRDELLIKRAFQRGLQNRETVKNQKRWWEEKIVYVVQKSFIANSIEQLVSRRALQNRETVENQKQWWEGEMAYEAQESIIPGSVKESDNMLQEFYEKNKRSYRNGKGEDIPFEKAKDDVRRDFYSFELTKELLHRILKLKDTYKVVIDEDALNNLYVDIENQPKAIDAYSVKKGGTFPHPAYPSIDYEWQTWN